MKKYLTSLLAFFVLVFIVKDNIYASIEESNTGDLVAYYRKVFDTEYQKNRISFDNMAMSGNGAVYYNFSYILDGTLCMYEATQDEKYLEQAIAWAETMVLKTKVVDSQGNKNWSGQWLSSYSETKISYHLEDLQGSTGLARLARIIKTNSLLDALYGGRATVIYEFVKEHIIDKWLYNRKSLDWFYNDVIQKEQPMNDKTALLMRILLDLYLVDGDVKYKDIVFKLADGFKKRFQPYKDSLIWDLGVKWPERYGGYSMDTSHANRYPYTVIDLYKADIVFALNDVKGLACLLTKVIWDQSYESPRFNNFIDGANGMYLKRCPWGNGQIYSGWIGLGEFDPEVQTIGDSVLKAILSGKRNPSLDYMSTVYGKIELAGHLAKNIANGQK